MERSNYKKVGANGTWGSQAERKATTHMRRKSVLSEYFRQESRAEAIPDKSCIDEEEES